MTVYSFTRIFAIACAIKSTVAVLYLIILSVRAHNSSVIDRAEIPEWRPGSVLVPVSKRLMKIAPRTVACSLTCRRVDVARVSPQVVCLRSLIMAGKCVEKSSPQSGYICVDVGVSHILAGQIPYFRHDNGAKTGSCSREDEGQIAHVVRV